MVRTRQSRPWGQVSHGCPTVSYAKTGQAAGDPAGDVGRVFPPLRARLWVQVCGGLAGPPGGEHYQKFGRAVDKRGRRVHWAPRAAAVTPPCPSFTLTLSPDSWKKIEPVEPNPRVRPVRPAICRPLDFR
jgi:hypothetical protein